MTLGSSFKTQVSEPELSPVPTGREATVNTAEGEHSSVGTRFPDENRDIVDGRFPVGSPDSVLRMVSQWRQRSLR